jgi:hypothetical protein
MKDDDSSLEERLLRLLSAVREEDDAGARTELNALLRAWPAARLPMARLLVDEQALLDELRDESIVALLNQQPASSAPALQRLPRLSRWWPAPLAAAAIFLVAGLAYWRWGGSGEGTVGAPSAPQVAVMTQAVEAQWDGLAFQPRDRIPAGRFALKSGVVRLQFLSGATVVIEGPAELNLTSDHGAEVRSGLVTASVPPVAEGFTLTAAGWRAVDRGTVFGIDARSPERTEVHVIQGKVELHRGDENAVQGTLTTGQAARLTMGSLVEQPAAAGRFPREAEVIDRAARATENQFHTWKEKSEQLARDADLVLYLDFETTDLERGSIRNRAPGGDSRSDASVIGGEWTPGRWPGKSAVAFQRVGDLIRTSLGAQLEAATFVVSLRVEPEAPLTQTILLTPDVGPGQMYWLLAGRGKSPRAGGMIFIKTDAERRDHRFVSGRNLTRRELGQWHTLALVHDPQHGAVRHYLDGVLVQESPLDDAHSLRLRQIVIGNWGYTSDPRNLTGRIDELAIFQRALSGPEISRLSLSLLP